MNKATVKKILAAISLTLVFCMSFAGCAMLGGAPAEGAEGGGTGGTIQLVISMVVLVAVFYFFMIRPERKRKKQTEEMRSSLSVGDPIVTIGGMVGKIVEISADEIVFETGEDRVRIEVKKWAISKKSK